MTVGRKNRPNVMLSRRDSRVATHRGSGETGGVAATEKSLSLALVPRPTAWRQIRRWMSTVAGVVAPLAVAVVLIPVRGNYAAPAAALTLVVVVAAVAVVGPRRAGVVASLSSALWFDLFLTHPYERLTISHGPELETTIAIFVVGILITELAARSRHHWGAANEAYHFVATIRDVAESGARGDDTHEVVERARVALVQLLDLRACRFDAELEALPLARIEPSGDVVHVGLIWPTGDIGLPGPECEIVARSSGRTVGRFVLTPSTGEAISHERLIAAVSVVDAAAAALATEIGR